MKNDLSKLNDVLFSQLERLGNATLTGEDLPAEISRAKAVCEVASHIVANGALVLKAIDTADGLFDKKKKMPAMLALE